MRFIKDCEVRGWWFKSKFLAGTTITHTMMNGAGVLNVPIQQRKLFYQICMEALKRKEKLFMVEQTKADRFRMFLDIDYLTDEAVTDESIKRWVEHLVRSFPSLGNVLVSTCCRSQGDKVKNGIHLSWPRTTVTSSSAMTIYERIKMALKSYDNDIPWETILDTSVFKTGLRTILSYKIKRDTRETVEPYVPRFDISDKGTRDFSNEKYTAEMMEYFSILSHGNETEHFGEKETIISGININNDILLSWLNEMYPNHAVQRIDKVIPKKTHWVLSVPSKFCVFQEKEHSQNHAYFNVDRQTQTICALCHDEDHKGLKGRKYMVNPKIIKYLQNLENKL